MTGFLVVYAILGAVLIWCHRQCQREHGTTALSRVLARHDEAEQFRRDYQAGLTAGGKDTLDALLRDDREQPHESYAWGPGERPPETSYVTVRVLDNCGCLRWLIHPDGFVEPAYDPCPADAAMAEVEQSRRPR